MRTLLISLLLATTLLGAASAQEADPYVRYRPAAGQLEVAVSTFRHPQTQVEVQLYGVVHIADADYYEAVQRDLDRCDVVLYELIKSERPEQATRAERELGREVDVGRTLADLLGFEHQLEALDYTRKHWVHADMSHEQVQAALGERARELDVLGRPSTSETTAQLRDVIRQAKDLGKALLDVFPGLRVKAKQTLAELLCEDEGKPRPHDRQTDVIVYQRNAHVMKVLRQQLQTRRRGKVAIFYGAGHHADLAVRLRKLGWQQSSKRWVRAWQIGAAQSKAPAKTQPKVYDF
ncbi:MAG TPA: hypothetical protein DEA08_12615 [Planctomycetes bacterium]|nr:hypothetical protein [Planctomycetota bacterium]